MTEVENPKVWMTMEAYERMSQEERVRTWRDLMGRAGLWPCLPIPIRDEPRMLVGMECIPLGRKNDD